MRGQACLHRRVRLSQFADSDFVGCGQSVKQLSSRWAALALLTPVLIILTILFVGVEGPEAAGQGKGQVQIALTGFINGTNGTTNLGFQSLLLNVISVRFNPSSDINTSESDPGWQTVGVPNGTLAGQTSPSLTFGSNFGPNGFAVSIGQGRSEIQIDLSLLQGGVRLFNTGSIKATTYYQVELVLDPATPGNLVSQCGTGTATGEGCIVYPLQFNTGQPSIRFVNPNGGVVTVNRKATTFLPLAINVQIGAAPQESNQAVLFTPQICALRTQGPLPNGLCPFTLPSNGIASLAGVITDTVDGVNNKGIVNAELVGTGNVVSSVPVDKKTHQYTMVLPVGNYDIYAGSGSGRSIDAHANVAIAAPGLYPLPNQSPDPFHFTITKHATRALSGKVIDACNGLAIPGASVELYGPATLIGDGSQCPGTGGASTCLTSCGFVNGTSGPEVPSGCMVIATSSSTNTGAYPLPGAGKQASPLTLVPELDTKGTNAYAVKMIASGYNTELLAATTHRNGLFECNGSGFPVKGSVIPCNFSMPHGEIDVMPSAAQAPATSPLNVLVNIEDSGTFNGENVGMINIPVGQTAPAVAQPIFVPASATPQTSPTATPTPNKKGTPTPTATPVFISAPAAYDLFASVQDIFGSAPQKNTGHSIAVQAGIAPPTYCQDASTGAPQATPGPLTCVGHGSVNGTLSAPYPDQNTLIVVQKTDAGNGLPVDLMANQVAQAQTFQNFSICAPAGDTYTVMHVETVPSATPSPVDSTSVTLAAPIVIGAGSPAPTPLCQGICSDFSSNSNKKSCLLCQGTNPGLVLQ